MAILPVVINVTKNPEGSEKLYTVTYRLKDMETGNFTSAARSIQANNKAEMKEAIRPRLQAFLESQQQKDQMIAVAQSAIDELITELGF